MDGLEIAQLYISGCETEKTGRRFGPEPVFRTLAQRLGLENPFHEKVMKAYWLGQGVSSQNNAKRLTHNFERLQTIEKMRFGSKLTPEDVNKLLNCLISFGKVIESNFDELDILHYRVLWRYEKYYWAVLKETIGKGFIVKAKPGKLISIHCGQARENIDAGQARWLEEITLNAIKAHNTTSKQLVHS